MDRLTLTWKVEDRCNILQHVEIVEKEKANPFSLGKELYIGEEKFEDLDEILARYVQPMAAFVRDILGYKYYLPNDTNDRQSIETNLKEEKLKLPDRFFIQIHTIHSLLAIDIDYLFVFLIDIDCLFVYSHRYRLLIRFSHPLFQKCPTTYYCMW